MDSQVYALYKAPRNLEVRMDYFSYRARHIEQSAVIGISLVRFYEHLLLTVLFMIGFIAGFFTVPLRKKERMMTTPSGIVVSFLYIAIFLCFAIGIIIGSATGDWTMLQVVAAYCGVFFLLATLAVLHGNEEVCDFLNEFIEAY